MIQTIFFDLDGTLTDSGPGIINSVSHALEKLKMPPLEDNNSWLVGPSLWDSFTKLGVPREKLDVAISLYRERYCAIGWAENSCYPGILNQLSKLHSDGYILCLATSKPIYYAKKITGYFGIQEYLTHQFGSELDGTRSDKTELLKFGLIKSNSRCQSSLMVGDRKHDIIGAKNNLMRSIGADYGYGEKGELYLSGADQIILDPTKLYEVIKILEGK